MKIQTQFPNIKEQFIGRFEPRSSVSNSNTLPLKLSSMPILTIHLGSLEPRSSSPLSHTRPPEPPHRICWLQGCNLNNLTGCGCSTAVEHTSRGRGFESYQLLGFFSSSSTFNFFSLSSYFPSPVGCP